MKMQTAQKTEQTATRALSTRQDVIGHIQDTLAQLPPAQQRAAHFVMNALSQVPFMTTTALAEAAQTSQATVTRLVLSLGFRSYLEFSETVSRVVLSELGEAAPPDRFEQSRSHPDPTSLLHQEAQHILQLAALVEGQTFQRVVQKLVGAREVIVVGMGASACIASHTALYLSRLRPGVRSVTTLDIGRAIETLNAGPDVWALVFTVPRIAVDLERYLTLLRRCQVPVVLVAEQAANPLIPYASELLVVPVSRSPTTSVPAAMLVLGTLLVDALAQAQPESTAAHLAAFEQLLVQELPQVLPETMPLPQLAFTAASPLEENR
ncbi:MurR/RpiR family transcriptional regulator [Deinococcus rubellus]